MTLKSNQERLLEGLRSQLLDQVARDPKRPGRKQERIRVLLDRARDALEMNISEVLVRSGPDGFAASTSGNGSPGGGKGGRMTMVIEVDGERDTVPTSSTERAAFAGTDRAADVGRSQVVDALREVESQLRHMDSAVLRLSGALDRLDRMRGQAAEDASPQCWVASVAHGLPWDRDWEPVVSTRFENVLDPAWPSPRPVCRWSYDFVRRNRRLPSRDEMLQYLERGRVQVVS